MSKKSLLKYSFKELAFSKIFAKFNKDLQLRLFPLSKVFKSTLISKKS